MEAAMEQFQQCRIWNETILKGYSALVRQQMTLWGRENVRILSAHFLMNLVEDGSALLHDVRRLSQL